MSQIIRNEKCDKCGKEYKDIWISFGHLDEDFEWKWKCEKCGFENRRLIKAFLIDKIMSGKYGIKDIIKEHMCNSKEDDN